MSSFWNHRNWEQSDENWNGWNETKNSHYTGNWDRDEWYAESTGKASTKHSDRSNSYERGGGGDLRFPAKRSERSNSMTSSNKSGSLAKASPQSRQSDVVAHAFMKGKAQGLSWAEESHKGKGDMSSGYYRSSENETVDLPILVDNKKSGKGNMRKGGKYETRWKRKDHSRGKMGSDEWNSESMEYPPLEEQDDWMQGRPASLEIRTFTPLAHETQLARERAADITPRMLESLFCIINSLYRDRIKPTTKILKQRLMQSYRTPTSEQCALIENFPSVCLSTPELYRVDYRLNDAIYLLANEPQWFEGWCELEGIVEDDFGEELWMEFSDYMDRFDEPLQHMKNARAGDRDEELYLAQELRQRSLPFLNNLTLGELCAVVRLARSKGLLCSRKDYETPDYLHEV